MTKPDDFVIVPRNLTFGMRIALEEAIIRGDRDINRVYRELLAFAPDLSTMNIVQMASDGSIRLATLDNDKEQRK